ncbi:MAG: CRISPR system precrRNA processing endoribonuclease RAMP protein Cas6 [Candidatus Ratteibacteria bacterium]
MRGGFGYAFRRIVCVLKNHRTCKGCFLATSCPYFRIFESSLKGQGNYFDIKEIPRPFSFILPFSNKAIEYTQQDLFTIRLLLFGKAVQEFPYFFLSFQQLSETGIGKTRAKFTVEQVIEEYPQQAILFSKGKEELLSCSPAQPFVSSHSHNADIKKLRLEFLSPIRLKFQNKIISFPEFHHIVRSIAHRTSMLAYYWGEQSLDIDWKFYIQAAEKIKICSRDLEWVDLKRYSSRQKQSMFFGGFVGTILYEGDLAPFFPLIEIGSYLHIGKNTTFGLGKYSIKETE